MAGFVVGMFALGLFVTAVVLMGVVLWGPSRQVRAESAMAPELQLQALLGQRPVPTSPVASHDAPEYDAQQLTDLHDLDRAD